MRRLSLFAGVLLFVAACTPAVPTNGPAPAAHRILVTSPLPEFEGKGIGLLLNGQVQDTALLSQRRPAVLRAAGFGPEYELWVENPDGHEFLRFTFRSIPFPIRHHGTIHLEVAELTSCYQLKLYVFLNEERQGKVTVYSQEKADC